MTEVGTVMDERARRVGENEAIFREVNDRIQRVGDISEAHTPEIVCECGDLSCVARFAMTPSEYAELRSRSDWFAIKPGHEMLDVERRVAERPTYVIVEKHPGIPTEIAETTDPRS